MYNIHGICIILYIHTYRHDIVWLDLSGWVDIGLLIIDN